MVVILKDGADSKKVKNLTDWLENQKISVHKVIGEYQTILGLIGDTSKIDIDLIQGLDIVEKVKRISEPYKNANRKFHPDDTIIDVGGHKIGGGNFQYFAGPCSVESREQIISIAKDVKKAGANILRGGAFKPRTSPYAFQGMRAEGLELLLEAKKETGMPIVTEIMDASHIDLFENVDIIQVGARNMQNFELLRALGRQKKPVLLKRGLAATYEEWLASAEYILREGNPNVVLCERGIRSYQSGTRGTLDLAAVPVMHSLTHLPVLVDPSHAAGVSEWVSALGRAAAAAGADGLMVEVHPNPEAALSDGEQALLPEEFARLADAARRVAQR